MYNLERYPSHGREVEDLATVADDLLMTAALSGKPTLANISEVIIIVQYYGSRRLPLSRDY